MDLEKLKIFCTLVKTGNLQDTEKLIKVKYATIRKRILSLEKDLGFKLFKTYDHKLTISSEGERFFSYANDVLNFSEKKFLEFEENKSLMARHITIATTNAIASLWLSDALSDFIKAFPDVRITIKASDESFDLLKREADVSICAVENLSKNLTIYNLTEYRMDLHASETYIKSTGLPKTIEDLKSHRIIAYSTGVPFPFEKVNWHLDYLSEDHKPAFNINSGGTIFNLVVKGLGIGSVSHSAVRHCPIKLIRILPKILSGPTIKIGYCFPKTRENSKTINTLYEYIKDKLD